MILLECDQDKQCSKNGKDKVGPRLTIKFEIIFIYLYDSSVG